MKIVFFVCFYVHIKSQRRNILEPFKIVLITIIWRRYWYNEYKYLNFFSFVETIRGVYESFLLQLILSLSIVNKKNNYLEFIFIYHYLIH